MKRTVNMVSSAIPGAAASRQDMYNYLDDLRNSGAINMFGAGLYLQDAFGLSKSEARVVVLAWMKQFNK